MHSLRIVSIVALVFSVSVISACSREDPAVSQANLFLAVKAHDEARVKEILRKGVKVNEPESPVGWTALHYAAQQGDPEIVKALVASGANPDTEGEKPGQTISTKTTPKAIAKRIMESAVIKFALTPDSSEDRGAIGLIAMKYSATMDALDSKPFEWPPTFASAPSSGRR